MSLSEKKCNARHNPTEHYHYHEEDVKYNIQNTERRLKEVIQMEWDKGMDFILTELREIFGGEFGNKLTKSDKEVEDEKRI